MRSLTRISLGLIALCAVSVLAFATSVNAKEYMIGLMTDRSGPTKNVGTSVGDGFHGYTALFNKQNNIPGHKVTVMEIDHGYNVPRGVEAFERFKAEGVVSISLFGTPHTVALTPRLAEEQLVGTSPGFGSAAGANGERFPYLFPAAASYWSQAATGMKFIMDNWKGPGKPKIAYLYYDNPAGREPFPILDELEKSLDIELRRFAVPPPGIEMRPQVLDISRRYRADWVLMHTFGRAPAVALKEFTRVGFPRNRIIGFVWAGGESDISVAGWEQSEGYYTIQFAHVGSSRKNLNHPVLQDIAAIYKERGEDLPASMDDSVYYNRGVMIAAIHTRAIRNAVEQNGANIDGEDVKNAMERINGFSLDGFMAPLQFTPQDHEGGGFVKLYQVKDGGFASATDWIQGYRDVVMKYVMAGN
jgi:branched-chain amino acid transport system substrate-binding protein